MKNTVQVRKQASTKRNGIQVSQPPKEKAKPLTTRLIFFDLQRDDTICCADIPAKLFKAMQIAASKEGVKLDEFITYSFQATLAQPEIIPTTAAAKESAQLLRELPLNELEEQAEYQAVLDAEFAPPVGKDAHGSCLAIYDRDGGGPVKKIPLSEAEFVDLLFAQGRLDHLRGQSPEKIVADAVREKLAPQKRIAGIPDFENIINRAISTIDLLESKLTSLMPEGNLCPSASKFDAIDARTLCGIGILVQEVKAELSTGFNEFCKCLVPPAAPAPVAD